MWLCCAINKYDCFIFLLIASLSAGCMGGALQPGRLFVIFFVPFLLKNWSLFIKYKYINRVFLFFLFWLIYGIVSLFWSLDEIQARKDIIYYPIHMCAFLEIVIFSLKSQKPVESITKGWVAAMLITFPIAFIEIFTNIHLPSTYLYHEEGQMFKVGMMVMEQKYAAVTFGNYNTYGTFLCFAFPFLLGLIIRLKSLLGQVFLYTVFFAVLYISVTNGSRGAFLSLSIMIILFLQYQKKQIQRSSKYIFLFAIFLVGYFLLNYGEDTFSQLQARLDAKSNIMEDDGRSQLIILSLESVLDSFFFGHGIGCVEKALGKVGSIILATHNFVLELLMQFGLIITALVVFFIFNLFQWSRRRQVPKDIAFIVKAGTLPFVFMMVINSGYLRELMTWSYFSSLFAMVLVANKSVENKMLKNVVLYN